jgi:hypothetical protein
VSVYSLIASRLGPIAAEFTDTETASLQGEVTGAASAGVGPVARSEISSRIQSTQAQTSQVLRKSVVQTTFKEPYELEEASLVLHADARTAPMLSNLEELAAQPASSNFRGWALEVDELTRGTLLEIEVTLEAEAIFRISAAWSSILEIVQESPELFQSGDYGEIAQISSVNRVIEKLLVGLIPLRGRAVDFEVVELNGKEWLVHHRLLEQLTGEPTTTRPLFLVGVAQQSLFWKDIRRVLFSGSRFQVFCRLAESGLQDSWTPVKLVDVLSEAAPDLGHEVDVAVRGALDVMRKAAAGTREVDEQSRRAMRTALLEYARTLASHHGKTLDEEDLTENGLLSYEQCNAYATLSERRTSFRRVTSYIESKFAIESDPVEATAFRTNALIEAGMGSDGGLTPLAASSETANLDAPEDLFLDAELVAIYW